MDAGLDAMAQDYLRLLEALDAAGIRAHPMGDDERWCAQELVEHLILTYRSTARVLEERLRKGRPTRAETTPEERERWERTIAAGRFPAGGKSPEPVSPGKLELRAASGQELAAMLRAEIERLDRLLNQCAEMFGTQPMASHFLFGPLSVEQWRVFHTVHGRHHLGQLAQILQTASS